MKKILKSIAYLSISAIILGCGKDNKKEEEEPPRDRNEVYQENISEIENFLKMNKLVLNGDELSFQETANEQESILKDNRLQFVNITNDSRDPNNRLSRIDDNVNYKLYYLILNEGGGKNPITIDDIFSAYSIYNTKREKIDVNNFGFWSSFPPIKNTLGTEVISGYRQIVTKIKTAENITTNPDGTYNYNNAGRIVAFIPSGLGYFRYGKGKITAYSPVIFDIKLIAIKGVDHDNDGILSKYEDVNNNNDFWDDDTDGDGTPNFLDLDDDADGKTTKMEITKQDGSLYNYDEIPNCNGGNTKIHLDKNCK